MLIKTQTQKSRDEQNEDRRQPMPTRIVSNGEFMPIPQTAEQKRVELLVEAMAAERAKALGMSRRSFMRSSVGTATALAALNLVHGCGDDDGGFAIDDCATRDPDAARVALSGEYFIMDVQTHHAETEYHKENGLVDLYRGFRGCPRSAVSMFVPEGYECTRGEHEELSRANYIKEILVDSETSLAVMSGIPAPFENLRFISNSEMAATRDFANQMGASERCISQGMITPNLPESDNQDSSVGNMQYLVEEMGIRALKTYTAAGGAGFFTSHPPWWMDDEDVAYPMLEAADRLGINTIAVHKGLNISFFDPEYLSPRDLPKAAAEWPQHNFVIYHASLDVGFDHEDNFELFLRLAEEGQLPSNVYPELGSSFGSKVVAGPIALGHFLGRLLHAFGEDNIVWGTDAMFNGTPQWQINAFKAFQMPEQLRDEFGYPEITDEIKAKIFGLNSAGLYGVDVEQVRCSIPGDTISQVKRENAELAILEPSLRTYGPKTRREFLRLKRREGFKV
jgi:predicted TIM-barrel fold metal-dependent hydrolase